MSEAAALVIETASDVIRSRVRSIVLRALKGEPVSRDEAVCLLAVQSDSTEYDYIVQAADQLSRRSAAGMGTIYSQIGINVWPCPENCSFCYLGAKHGIVTTMYELSLDEVVEKALEFERDGADEVYLMTTANYPVDRFLAIGRAVRKVLSPGTELIANIGDFDLGTAQRLVEAGFAGVYHVYRFREGVETEVEPARRRATFDAIRKARLDLRYCIEPVGPEHTNDEIADQMMLAREFGATVLSVMRRVAVKGTPYEDRAELSSREVSKIVAVARLTLGTQLRQMGVHEPSLDSLRAGAHRLCAEVGMNPRDLEADTTRGRGLSVLACEKMLEEAGYAHRRAVGRGSG
ncbi:MAG: radical SAM protein [Chloroflexi bacterium]|nr:radical SAM protein [Chloroflexota bacterium]